MHTEKRRWTLCTNRYAFELLISMSTVESVDQPQPQIMMAATPISVLEPILNIGLWIFTQLVQAVCAVSY